MGEGHLFQDPLSRLDWTPGWDCEQITLGDCEDPRNWGEGTRATGSVAGGGAETPPSKRPRVSRTHSDTLTPLTPGGGGCPGRPGSEREQSFAKGKGGGGGEGSEDLDTRRTGGGREEVLEFIRVTSTPASHIEHS